MRSVYYIAPSSAQHRLDDLWDQEDLLATFFDSGKISSLVNFIQHDKGVQQQSYIIIDVGGLSQWTRSHVLSAVQHLKRFTSAQLIVIGQPCDEVSILFRALTDIHKISDLITAATDDNIINQVRDCISPNVAATIEKISASSRINLQAVINKNPGAFFESHAYKKITVPNTVRLTVAVAGTMPRSGTTTQAAMTHHYMSALGFKPVIVDCSGQLFDSVSEYEADADKRINGDLLITHGVRITRNSAPEDCNAVIIDIGVLTAANAARFAESDISMLVGGIKKWELAAMASALLLLLPYHPHHQITVASFATPDMIEELSKYFKTANGVAPYAPDIWSLPEDLTLYNELLHPVLESLCSCKAEENDYGMEEEH